MADAPETSDLMEESDRGCVLVGAAILEEALVTVFKAVFNRNGISRKTQKDLFEANGPLAAFSGKVKLAYAMGLIDQQTFEDLDTIRRVRNEFAHTQARVDFLDARFKPIVEGLHSVRDYRGRIKRYDLSSDAPENERPDEHDLRKAGYVKHSKAIFCLGVKTLEVVLMRQSIMATRGTPHV